MDEHLFFASRDHLRIEGLYVNSGDMLGAVISHPHPLMGGDMRNSVVERLSDALSAAGISTLRFNFRGVGNSSGAFDNGRGEQEDVLAAVSYMEGRGVRGILLAGYSFGAWVSAAVLPNRMLLPALFVAPPLTHFSFDFKAIRNKVGTIISGIQDEFCPSDRAREMAQEISCRLDLIPDTNHFFMGRERELASSINGYAIELREEYSL
jgi:alpha/beta superfamily hydrolase